MSRKQAIDQYCKECIYDPKAIGEGTWRQQVEACTHTPCPLYTYRPKSYSEQDSLAKIDKESLPDEYWHSMNKD